MGAFEPDPRTRPFALEGARTITAGWELRFSL
jgi:hypothetical protein